MDSACDLPLPQRMGFRNLACNKGRRVGWGVDGRHRHRPASGGNSSAGRFAHSTHRRRSRFDAERRTMNAANAEPAPSIRRSFRSLYTRLCCACERDRTVSAWEGTSLQSREPRIDIMRGLALVVITLNHTALALYSIGLEGPQIPTPSRYGYSSSALQFVALSGTWWERYISIAHRRSWPY